ncbi:hypothetical protein [Noviherbaspirillum saxi]|uniref:Uncharacterized protein n=1 Tax=Noviherbaspirillum saxi TaxID=2320863 RepID=A0A3A3FRB2_9BURK|nr:hypothetical protein [Noviherbaspirillum saxi]RJF98586.1 hypothetical protein D3871_08740 [Noviherbaspirillum saxi]
MMRALRGRLIAAICIACSGALLGPLSQAANEQVASAPTFASKALFAKPVALRGKLGDADIQATLRNKEQMEEGIEGEYFYFGRSLKVLLAGEIEGEDLFMEESENGTDVSGQWEGKLQGDMLAGEWQSADGKIKKPFSLRIVKADEKTTQKPPAGGKSVNGKQ